VRAGIDSDPRFAAIHGLKPQMGLIPLGRNAAGFFEFAVAESGLVDARPQSRPKQAHAAAILVLLPGGTLKFDPRVDPASLEPDPDVLVTTQVGPYFIGKHEINQFQWRLQMGRNPSFGKAGDLVDAEFDDRHPVENVTWIVCAEFCKRLGVRLPTQDEWELAARAAGGLEYGDSARREDLEHHENLCDRTHIEQTNRKVGFMPWYDRYWAHAPVGSFKPNSFGLHDMLGNVSEWCDDRWFAIRRPSDQTSPDYSEETEGRRVYRGANYMETDREASCRNFRGRDPEGKTPQLGLRIARSIER